MPGRGAAACLAAVWCFLLAHPAAALPSHSPTHPSTPQTLSRIQGPAIRNSATAFPGVLQEAHPEVSRAETACTPALALRSCRGGWGAEDSEVSVTEESEPSGELLANGAYRIGKHLFESEAVRLFPYPVFPP